jgi:hypothetical protein
MSAQSRKSITWASVLIMFGLGAFFAGTSALVVLIPAALLIWYGVARPLLHGERN